MERLRSGARPEAKGLRQSDRLPAESRAGGTSSRRGWDDRTDPVRPRRRGRSLPALGKLPSLLPPGTYRLEPKGFPRHAGRLPGLAARKLSLHALPQADAEGTAPRLAGRRRCGRDPSDLPGRRPRARPRQHTRQRSRPSRNRSRRQGAGGGTFRTDLGDRGVGSRPRISPGPRGRRGLAPRAPPHRHELGG